MISTAQLDFFHGKVENHSIQVMHGGVQMAVSMSHKKHMFVGKHFFILLIL